MIPYGRHHIDETDIEAVTSVLKSQYLTQGPTVDAFERAICDYTGARYAVAVSSATSGLHLAALAAGVEPGTFSVTSPITFVASANAAAYAGGSHLFVDIDRDTLNMSPDLLARVLKENDRVKMVVPVHFSGQPCDMASIEAVSRKAGACIVEDAAHALGGRYEDGSRIGSNPYSDMTVFSFHPVKAVAAGEGGVITTNSEDLYKRLLRLRSHGINKLDDPFVMLDEAFEGGKPNPWYYEMLELGYNYRITDIQAALAASQLKRLDSFIQRRRQLAEAYDTALATFQFLRPAHNSPRRDLSGHHLYVVRIDFDRLGKSRGDVMRALKERGVGSQVHYIPVTSQPYYARMGHRTSDFPEALSYYREGLSIPLFYSLTDEQQTVVIDTLREVVG